MIFLRLLSAVYFSVLVTFITLILFFLTCLCQLMIPVWGLRKTQDQIHRIASFWGWFIMEAMPIWRIEIIGRPQVDPSKPVVFVANHQSMADIWAMFCTWQNFRWIAKSSLFHIPAVGQAMRWAGYVSVKRGDVASHASAMIAAADVLKSGRSMFFFPEGTRSVDGKVKKFKLGAFRLATQLSCDVVPIVITGAGQLLPKGTFLPAKATVRVEFLEKILLEKFGDDPQKIADACQSKIIERLATLPALGKK